MNRDEPDSAVQAFEEMKQHLPAQHVEVLEAWANEFIGNVVSKAPNREVASVHLGYLAVKIGALIEQDKL